MKEYQVIRGVNLDSFVNAVQIEILKGWLPLGGIVIDTLSTEHKYLQSMIKPKVK